MKNNLLHTDIIIKHTTFGYQIGYGSDIAFTISVSAPNLTGTDMVKIIHTRVRSDIRMLEHDNNIRMEETILQKNKALDFDILSW